MPPQAAEVRVAYRNLRWEVRVNGFARPMVDWFCTADRALEHAMDRARDVDAALIIVEAFDRTVEAVIPLGRTSSLAPLHV
jgi:hypothetical protein